MTKVNTVREFLIGKKTYITAAIGILGAVMAWSQGQIDGIGLIAMVWAALQTCFIRAAVTESK